MSRGHRSSDIPALALKGVENAFKEFEGMTQGEWLNAAPEYMVTTHVARSLDKGLDNSSVFLEYSVDETLKEAGSTKRGKPRSGLRRNGRFDILLTRKNLDPWCVVEVKSPVWTPGTIEKDLLRIQDALDHRKHDSTLRCGASVFYTDAAPPKSKKHEHASAAIAAFSERIEEFARRVFSKDSGYSVRLESGKIHTRKEGDAWQAFCLFVEVARSRK